jgi:hypothetical protein
VKSQEHGKVVVKLAIAVARVLLFAPGGINPVDTTHRMLNLGLKVQPLPVVSIVHANLRLV